MGHVVRAAWMRAAGVDDEVGAHWQGRRRGGAAGRGEARELGAVGSEDDGDKAWIHTHLKSLLFATLHKSIEV